MFQNRKIVSNLYEIGFCACFVPRSNPSLLRTVQSQPFWNIGTFLYFQELATPHFGTLWNNAEDARIQLNILKCQNINISCWKMFKSVL